jgi:hypothetical protein
VVEQLDHGSLEDFVGVRALQSKRHGNRIDQAAMALDQCLPGLALAIQTTADELAILAI